MWRTKIDTNDQSFVMAHLVARLRAAHLVARVRAAQLIALRGQALIALNEPLAWRF